MARSTIKNQITTAETINQILQENKNLINDFLIYLKSIDRSPNTIKQYKNDLEIFFVYNLQNNNNKPFVDITKREFVRFQSYAIEEWKWSPNRLRRVKSVLSSLSNYIENILDDEYPNFRNLIAKIESPAKQNVRENASISDYASGSLSIYTNISKTNENGDFLENVLFIIEIMYISCL